MLPNVLGEATLLDVFVTALTGLIAIGLAWLRSYLKDKALNTEIMDALWEGISKAEIDLVQQAKKAAEDGKLTVDEIKAARDVAIKHAMDILTGPAKERLLTWGSAKLEATILKLLAGGK